MVNTSKAIEKSKKTRLIVDYIQETVYNWHCKNISNLKLKEF
jgi:hypothetical protein